ncbi:glycerophosphodiester phosphodiesterase [Streptomyces cinnamoneus]|uniref:Glycerophosphodiester phosphodiesterase n=1 Tax=Streptomyces cinnamoneus TaxID=53446 RepID=A0A2G1XQ75_STRCJ|nr:glycerophosphodiester phosphodiesterase family protein [Streptomyces cinnamoneus]PHQ48619.1 glycerophosphodiester phosphodiesterase [Streptomyces cinnamoneus]PHQ53386.1 glycerophosphodiester phosphodiesterase [Streptomyces cinnamoneus]PPT12701.1 glycerophosphodiester phosphodiesterase [Streptomyces cinnamoneus]
MRIRPASAVTSAFVGLSVTALTALGSLGVASPPVHAAQRVSSPVVIGHRGVPARAPENTLASIDRAAKLGVRWVENDVQRTKDGALIVMHDTTLARTTDVEQRYPDRAPWKVSDFTLAEIQKLDAGSWYAPRFAGERVPTLSSYLRRVDRNRQKLLLEVKAPELYPGIERQILAELDRTGWLDRRHVDGRLVVQSFDAASLRTVHQLRPDVKTGFLGAPKPSELRSYAAFADQINPSYKSVTEAWVRSVHALKGPHGRRLEVSAWTVDDGDDAVSLARKGVDGIISNAPHEVAAALAEDADDDAFLNGLTNPADTDALVDGIL